MHLNSKSLNIIDLLTQIQSRVSMFIGSSSDIDRLYLYLSGFREACRIFDYDYDMDIEHQVFRANGWERRANGVHIHMRERGMTDEQIVQEILRLEIEKWKKFQETLDKLEY